MGHTADDCYIKWHNVRLNYVRNLSSLPTPLAKAKDVDNPGCVVSWEQKQGRHHHTLYLAHFVWLLWKSSSDSSRLSTESDLTRTPHLSAAVRGGYAWWRGALGLTCTPGSSWRWARGKLRPWEPEPAGSRRETVWVDGKASAPARRSTVRLQPALTFPQCGWSGFSSTGMDSVFVVWIWPESHSADSWGLSSCQRGASLSRSVAADRALHQPGLLGRQPAAAERFASSWVETWLWEYLAVLCLHQTHSQSQLVKHPSLWDIPWNDYGPSQPACKSSACSDKLKAQAVAC